MFGSDSSLTTLSGSFSRIILGRTTNLSYSGGGSDSISYTPEGWISSFSNYAFAFDTRTNRSY